MQASQGKSYTESMSLSQSAVNKFVLRFTIPESQNARSPKIVTALQLKLVIRHKPTYLGKYLMGKSISAWLRRTA